MIGFTTPALFDSRAALLQGFFWAEGEVNAKLESAAGKRILRVDSRCRELIKDLEQVTYKENSLLIDKDRDSKRTHLSDALGYLIWQECRGAEKIGERGLRLI